MQQLANGLIPALPSYEVAASMFVDARSAEDLTNEQYHEDEIYITGSSLWTIYSKCPAAWRFQKAQEAKAKKLNSAQKPLTFGTTSHTMLLEPDRFEREFFRLPNPDDFPDLITSVAKMQSWLKERGQKGYSNKSAEDLIAMCRMIQQPDEVLHIWHEIEAQAIKEANGREIVPAKDWDRVHSMRDVLLVNHNYRRIIETGIPELSLFCIIDGVPVKVRLDRVTDLGEIIDYKTTQSAEPERFGRLAHDLGYWCKMALQHDCFKLAYQQDPTGTKLLVQEKDEPWLALMNRLTPEQIMIGRAQYKTALQLFKHCREADVWPAYANGQEEIPLSTPMYLQQRYKEYFKEV